MEYLYWYIAICIVGTLFTGALLRRGGAAADAPQTEPLDLRGETSEQDAWSGPKEVVTGANRIEDSRLRQEAQRIRKQNPTWSAKRVVAAAKQQLIADRYTSDPQSIILASERQ